MSKKSSDLLFEVSWEVCNKVGGIYTVLSTKATALKDNYKDNLIFIGPDVWTSENPSPYFKESKTLMKAWQQQPSLPYGIKVRVGRWNIPGSPVAVLVDFHSIFAVKNDFYATMWNEFRVDSLHAYGDYDEACAFGLASAMVIQSILAWKNKDKKVSAIAHFDEWTVGMGLLYTKLNMPEVATVFTTHATSIGRSICGNNKPLYDYMSGYNGDQMAMELNMESKHSLEKAAAHNADAFTTVSDVTAKECCQLLDINPAVVTPNGFESAFVPTGDEYTAKRKAARARLLKVASALTGESYDDNTFIIATSGRNEFRNKGLDLFVDAVAKIKNAPTAVSRPVIAFVMVPAWISGPRTDLQQAVASGSCSPLGVNFITHSLHYPESDALYSKINYSGIDNNIGDKVKIIYVPSYLNGNEGIFDMTYYDLLPGFDLTAFPSYYEPWGYTPLESVAFGVPTVTTNLSGFGQWVLGNSGNEILKSGVKVLERNDSNYWTVVENLASLFITQIALDPDDVKKASSAALATAAAASWDSFIKYYKEAYDKAVLHANSFGQ